MIWSHIYKVGLGLVLVVGCVWGGPVQAQPDSLRAEILKEKGFSATHSPRGALWRAAAIPGWGQLYNRQYLKIPFVYAGFGVLGYTIHRADQQYRLFRRAALFKNESDPRPEFESEYIEALKEATGCTTAEQCRSTPLNARQLRQQRDELRRRRNLAIIGTGVFYALTILDAYVSAHLLTFDVDDNLAIRVHPNGAPPVSAPRPFGERPRDGPAGHALAQIGMGLHVQLQF